MQPTYFLLKYKVFKKNSLYFSTLETSKHNCILSWITLYLCNIEIPCTCSISLFIYLPHVRHHSRVDYVWVLVLCLGFDTFLSIYPEIHGHRVYWQLELCIFQYFEGEFFPPQKLPIDRIGIPFVSRLSKRREEKKVIYLLFVSYEFKVQIKCVILDFKV